MPEIQADFIGTPNPSLSTIDMTAESLAPLRDDVRASRWPVRFNGLTLFFDCGDVRVDGRAVGFRSNRSGRGDGGASCRGGQKTSNAHGDESSSFDDWCLSWVKNGLIVIR